MPKPNLLLLILLFAVLAYFAWRSEQAAIANRPGLHVEEDGKQPGTVIFRWKGEVYPPLATRLEEAFSEWRDKVGRVVIELDSPGGLLREGREAIEVIEWMKKTHTVDTKVDAFDDCLSMCVPIFLRGETRYAASSSRFMFHEPSSYDVFTGERAETPGFERRIASRRFLENYFVNSEMDPEWRDGLVAQWAGKDIWKTGAELVDEGANVVTVLE